MGYEPRLITFFNNGLVKKFKPWLISNDAFPDISNAYPWRGVVKKREGYQFFAALPGGDAPVQGLKNWINPSTLSQTLVAFSITKSYAYDPLLNIFVDISFLASGAAFSWINTINDYFWASNYAGSMWVTNNVPGQFMRYWTGVTVNGWSNFRPTVNGTTQMLRALIIIPYKGRLVALNTFETGASFPSRARWSQIGTPYTSNTTATNITNITAANPAVVTVGSTAGFVIGQPAGILDVQGSMASLLNFNQFNVSAIGGGTITIDVDTTGLTYVGGTGTAQGPGTTVPPTPFQISIFGWRDDIPGRGGYVDADTSERIVSAEIVKDVLIVAFQRSTWRLRYTGNEILPFIWERLNTQYGAESTFSNIPFDEDALFFSRFGWIASTTNDVARIDQQIPDDSFSVESTDSGLTGLARIQGIRDYYRQFAYWAFPAIEGSLNEPDRIYAYNYIDKSWSIFTPSVPIRVFGSSSQNYDQTWQSLNAPADTWANFNNAQSRWSSFGTSQNIEFPQILGGDDAGNVYTMFEFGSIRNSDNGTNFDFNILTKTFNPYIEKGLNCRIGYVDVYCTTLTGGEFTFNHYVNDQTTPVFSRKVEIFPRSQTAILHVFPGFQTQFQTATPHNLINDQQVLITGMTGTIGDVMNNKQFSITRSSPDTFITDFNGQGYVWNGGGVIQVGLRPNYGSATYTRIYLGAVAHMHQFEFTLTNDQVADPLNGTAQFELQGMVIWSRPTGMIRG